MQDDKTQNPYAAPTAEVLTAKPESSAESFIPGGRSTSVGQGIAWVGHGWSLFTQSPMIWVVNIVIFFATTFALGLIPMLGTLIGYALFGFFGGALMLGAHAQHNGRPLEVSDIFAGFKAPYTTPLLTVGLLYMASWLGLMILMGTLFVVVLGVSGAIGAILSGDTGALGGLLVGAGLGTLLVLLIVMAVALPIFMAFWFAPALVAINGMSPIDALAASFKGCLKNILPFLLYGVVFLVLFIVGSIPLGLGLLVVLPLMFASTYAAYRDIFLGDDGHA
ncbi:MAG: BPSS1780 family membrane protein [Burkholderiales bacterium]